MTNLYNRIRRNLNRVTFYNYLVPNPHGTETGFMDKTLKFLPILIPLLFYIGYLHVKFYYSSFNITINEYVTLDEIILLSIDYLDNALIYLTPVLIATGLMVYLHSHTLGNEQSQNRFSLRITFAFYVTIIVIVVILAFFLLYDQKIFLKDLLAWEILLKTMIISWFLFIIGIANRKLTMSNGVLMMIVLLFASNILVGNSLKVTKMQHKNKFSDVYLKNGDVYPASSYLGATRNYVFFRSNVETLVFSKSEVELVRMKSDSVVVRF